MLLGCIGDDFTGSSDLANTLAKQGMKVAQYTGVPVSPAEASVEAGVVALKSRSIPVAEAERQSLEALAWLQAQGCKQIFFKYCSTFDSTVDGNIGPVAQALADALKADRVIFCPAFPSTGRSIYQGHLFVNDHLLSESGMENHPLTPMSDPDLRRWLSHQTTCSVGHVPYSVVETGAVFISEKLLEQQVSGHRFIVVDALSDPDLMEIGEAVSGLPLVTGGSGVAMGMPANFGISGGRVPWQGQAGKCVALSGSCSIATRGQVALHLQGNPGLEVGAAGIISGKMTAAMAADWAMQAVGLPIIYSSADPDVIRAVQAEYGREASAAAIEDFFAEVARLLVNAGVTKLLPAGGETSGAVVEGLGLATLEIGPEIDPGVPALRASGDLVIALKSGNFGSKDYFTKAERVLSGA
jgi:uncharacterized protein YgbK (DUF1537 family)